MPEREVRYCTTEDGVRIAYCVEGAGPPLVAMPVDFESFSLDHYVPVYKQFIEALGTGRTVIRFDWRGIGLSQRNSDLPNAESHLFDLEAVVNAACDGQTVIWASTTAGPPAIEFTAWHPDLVSHLVLYGTWASTTEFLPVARVEALAELAATDWSVASQTIADMNGRRDHPNETAMLADWYRESITPEAAANKVRRWATADASVWTAKIRTPTLVLHRIDDPAIPLSAAQRLAAEIPGAKLIPLQGNTHLSALGDTGPMLRTIHEFLPRTEARSPVDLGASAFCTVLFTDIVGHTHMMQRLGDEAGRAVLRDHERITREELAQHGGVEVKTMGDGFMASFGSVTKGLECAVALQRAFAEHNASATEPLQVRVGLNAGEPIEEEGPDGRSDLFGSTVILAARIAAQAGGGEILASVAVRELAMGKGFLFAGRGEHALRGFEDPVRMYEVRWQD